MSAIFKPVGKLLSGELLSGLLGGRPPTAPAYRSPPMLGNEASLEAGSRERKRRMNAQGRASTLLSVDSGANTGFKSLLGG